MLIVEANKSVLGYLVDVAEGLGWAKGEIFGVGTVEEAEVVLKSGEVKRVFTGSSHEGSVYGLRVLMMALAAKIAESSVAIGYAQSPPPENMLPSGIKVIDKSDSRSIRDFMRR